MRNFTRSRSLVDQGCSVVIGFKEWQQLRFNDRSRTHRFQQLLWILSAISTDDSFSIAWWIIVLSSWCPGRFVPFESQVNLSHSHVITKSLSIKLRSHTQTQWELTFDSFFSQFSSIQAMMTHRKPSFANRYTRWPLATVPQPGNQFSTPFLTRVVITIT